MRALPLLLLVCAPLLFAEGPPYFDPDRSLNKQSDAASAAVDAIRKGADAEAVAGYFAEKSAEVRDRTFEAVLERGDDTKLLEGLTRYLGDKNAFVAAGVAEVFAATKFAGARKLLEKRGLTAGDQLAQLEAIWALAALGDAASAKPLKKLHKKAKDYRVKGDALIAWAQIDPEGARADAEKALAHKLPPVRIAGLVALQAIEGKAALRAAKSLIETELKGKARAWEGRLIFAALDAVLSWTNRSSHVDLAKELVDVMIERLGKVEGLPQHRINQALQNLTGQKIAPNPDMWRGWWQSKRESFTPAEPPAKSDKAKPKGPKAGDAEPEEQGGRKGPKTGDETTRVRFHGIPIYSKRLTFSQDVSGGMNNPIDGEGSDSESKMVFSKRELIRVLGQLGGDVMGNVVFFATEYYRVSEQLLPLKRAREKLAEFVRNQQTPKKVGKQGSHKGRSNLYDTLAFSMQDPQIDTIFFLSEGGPNEGRFMRSKRFMRHLEKLNRYQRVQVHCLQVSYAKGGARFLRKISELTGGTYYSLDEIKAAHAKK